MSIAPIRTRTLGPVGVLIAVVVLVALYVSADSVLARERPWNDPDRIATDIEIDDDAIIIHTESRDGGDPKTIEIAPEGRDSNIIVKKNKHWLEKSKRGLGARIRWDLSDLDDLDCIDIKGCDGDAVVRFGEDIHIRRGKSVDGDVVAIGGSVRIDGDVDGDVVALGGCVTISSRARIEGDVVAVAGDLVLHDGCEVDGDAVSVGGEIMDDGARIGGDTVRIEFDLW